jgi:hypothetical protein
MDEILYSHLRQVSGQNLWAGIVIGMAAGFIAGIYW